MKRNEYDSYILIDFSKTTTKVRNLFKNHLEDLDTFFELLQLYYATKLKTRKSLVIFDEIQAFQPARAAVKHLVAQMLTMAKHKLYFYNNPDRLDASRIRRHKEP